MKKKLEWRGKSLLHPAKSRGETAKDSAVQTVIGGFSANTPTMAGCDISLCMIRAHPTTSSKRSSLDAICYVCQRAEVQRLGQILVLVKPNVNPPFHLH